jgi:hypothetical protein
MRLADPDLWGYLAYGRLFLEQGQLTNQDVFAYTSAGQHWVTFEYLAHLLLWIVYDAIGHGGLIALKCVVGGAALYYVYCALRASTDDPRIWLPLFAMSAATVSRFFLFRPQLFTFAFFAYFVAVLTAHLRRGDRRLWTLPLVMLIWANTHGGFLAGLGAIGLAIVLQVVKDAGSGPVRFRLVTGDARSLGLVFGACVASTLVNPQGWRLWSYVLTEVGHGTNRKYIAEWAPVSLTSGDVWSSGALAVVTILLVVAGWLATRRVALPMRPQPVFWLLSCLPIIVMSCLSVRHVPIAMIWTAPVVAALSTAGAPAASLLYRRLWALFSAAAFATVYLAAVVVWMRPAPTILEDGAILGSTHPCRAVAFLRANGFKGNIYNPLWWGSYVSWVLYPDVLVSMDGRNISLFPDAMVTENMRFYTDPADAVDLDAPLRYPTQFVLAPADMPALPRLLDDARWAVVYSDADALLFIRATHANRPLIDAVRSGGAIPAPPPIPCPPTL